MSYLYALVSLISDTQLLSNLVIVCGDRCELLLDLSLAAREVHVDYCQLVDAGLSFLVRQFDGALGAKGLVHIQLVKSSA